MFPEELPDNSCLAVEVSGVHFSFRKEEILSGLNLAVGKGDIYGLLGPSGCGKTTLLRCIVGRHKPSSGTIKIYDKLPGQAGFCVPGPGVGFMPQELALYPEISVEETLFYFGRVYQLSDKHIKERIDFLTEFLDIPDKKKIIRKLSGGQQRRVSFAAALIHKPPLVILDEPTVGVDPLLRKSIWNYLHKLATVDNLTIIITTHYVEEARQAHVVGLMRDGRLLAEENPEYLIEQHNVKTLEDVFLKLCVKATSEAQEDSSIFGKTEDEEQEETSILNEGPRDEVWMKQKKPRKHYHLPAVEKNGSGQRDSLLFEHSDPESLLNPEKNSRSVIRESLVRMRALITKNYIRLKRNIPLVFFQLFVPTFQVIVFCLCVGGEPFDLPLAVVNNDHNEFFGRSTYFLQHLSNITIRQVHYSNLTPAVESVKRGENWGVLHIGADFTDNIMTRYLEGITVTNDTIESSTIMLYLDMTNKQILMTLYTKIIEGFQLFSRNALAEYGQNPLLAEPPLKLGDPIYGHEQPAFTEFMAPGMILGITYIMAVSLSAMSIILEKKEGLLDRSWIAGVKAWEVMFSILFTLFVVMVFQVVLVLLFTFLAFNLSCLGPLVWVVICVLLAGLEGMSYGLFISAICNDENIAVMIAMGSFYPNLLLSGIIWPVEAMPYYLKQFSYCLPLTLLANTMRCVLSRGWGITEHGIWAGYLVAIAWIIPVIIISSLFFKYKK